MSIGAGEQIRVLQIRVEWRVLSTLVILWALLERPGCYTVADKQSQPIW